MATNDTIYIMGQPTTRAAVEMKLRVVVLVVCTANLVVNILRLTRKI